VLPLLDEPAAVPVLAPLAEQEIVYRPPARDIARLRAAHGSAGGG
jgi:hypothetical protein